MSVLLLGARFVTTMLIPRADSGQRRLAADQANGRALAYLAHRVSRRLLRHALRHLSTIAILWFAGASAMAGLLNLVPRYLPRYGMAPDWARATRPLVLVFTAIALWSSSPFDADVDAQGGAYATGVLVLITLGRSGGACPHRRRRQRRRWPSSPIAAGLRLHDRRQHHRAAGGHQDRLVLHRDHRRHVVRFPGATQHGAPDQPRGARWRGGRLRGRGERPGPIQVIANQPDRGDAEEYEREGRAKREDHHLRSDTPVLFLEVTVQDASAFSGVVRVTGVNVDGHRILRAEGSAVPNTIAALLLHLRQRTGAIPHVYFGWTEGNPLLYLLKYVVFGEGDIAPVTHEVLRKAEPDPARRPVVHVGG